MAATAATVAVAIPGGTGGVGGDATATGYGISLINSGGGTNFAANTGAITVTSIAVAGDAGTSGTGGGGGSGGNGGSGSIGALTGAGGNGGAGGAGGAGGNGNLGGNAMTTNLGISLVNSGGINSGSNGGIITLTTTGQAGAGGDRWRRPGRRCGVAMAQGGGAGLAGSISVATSGSFSASGSPGGDGGRGRQWRCGR